MNVKLELSQQSINSFANSLRAAALRMQSAAQQGMDVAAQDLYGKTQIAVPRVTGALASSGGIASFDSGGVMQRTVGYGDSTTNPRTGRPTSEYAPRVHEIFVEAHPDSYKWLERVLRDYGRGTFIEDLAASIRAAL